MWLKTDIGPVFQNTQSKFNIINKTLLTCKTLRFTATFPEFSSSGFWRRGSHTTKSIAPFQFILSMMNQKRKQFFLNNPTKQNRKNGLATRIQKLRLLNRLWVKRRRSDYLMLDISSPLGCSPPSSSHGATKKLPEEASANQRMRGPEMMRSGGQGGAPRFALGQEELDGGRGEGGRCGSRGIIAPIAAPCHTPNAQSRSSSVPAAHCCALEGRHHTAREGQSWGCLTWGAEPWELIETAVVFRKHIRKKQH